MVCARFSKRMRQIFLFTVLCVLALTNVTSADVRIEPTFGHPYIFPDRIVFTSVDGQNLIGIDKQGHLKWELPFHRPILLQRSADQLLVQSGSKVFRVNVSSGARSQVFQMPTHEILIANIGLNFLAATDSRFDHKRVRIISSADNSTAWESSSLESIIAVTSLTVVGVTADRKYDRKQKSFTLENGYLRGFNRETGQIRWSMPLNDTGVGSVESAQVRSFLVFIDRLRRYDSSSGDSILVTLNPDTGEVFSKRDGNFTDLWPTEDSLTVLERGIGGAEAEIYFCKLPVCTKEKPISLSAKEIIRVRLYGQYIITAGIYDAACFERATGRQLWEKGQLEWSEPFDDEMVVTNFSRADQTARIVAVELSNGKEHVLFSRTVTAHDRASFRPW